MYSDDDHEIIVADKQSFDLYEDFLREKKDEIAICAYQHSEIQHTEWCGYR